MLKPDVATWVNLLKSNNVQELLETLSLDDRLYDVKLMFGKKLNEYFPILEQEKLKSLEESQIKDLDSQGIDPFLIQATVSYLLKKDDEAILLYDKVIKADSNNALCLFGKGITSVRMGSSKEAFLFKKFFQDQEAINYLIEAKAALENLEEAIKFFEAVISSEDEDILIKASAYIKKGECLTKTNEFSKALDCFNNALSLNPDCIFALLDKILTLRRIDRSQEALDLLEGLINKLDAKIPIDVSPAQLADKMRVIILTCKDIISADPNNFHLYLDMARNLHRKKKLNEAIKYYNEYIQKDPNNIIAYIDRGVALVKNEDFQGALKNYEEAAKLAPQNLFVLCSQADALRKQGRKKEALLKYGEMKNMIRNDLQDDSTYIKALEKMVDIRHQVQLDSTDSKFLSYAFKVIGLKELENNVQDEDQDESLLGPDGSIFEEKENLLLSTDNTDNSLDDLFGSKKEDLANEQITKHLNSISIDSSDKSFLNEKNICSKSSFLSFGPNPFAQNNYSIPSFKENKKEESISTNTLGSFFEDKIKEPQMKILLERPSNSNDSLKKVKFVEHHNNSPNKNSFSGNQIDDYNNFSHDKFQEQEQIPLSNIITNDQCNNNI